MIEKLDRRQQRQLAIGLLAVLVVAVLLATAGPVWVANTSRQTALNDANDRLQRYQQTSAVAGAELQRLVKAITGRNQAQILSTQLLPVSEEQGFLRVALKVRLRGDLPAILQSLYDIETDDVYMFVDQVALRDNMIGRSRAQIRAMDAEFELVAYMPEAS